jgi:hypothetical protein
LLKFSQTCQNGFDLIIQLIFLIGSLSIFVDMSFFLNRILNIAGIFLKIVKRMIKRSHPSYDFSQIQVNGCDCVAINENSFNELPIIEGNFRDPNGNSVVYMFVLFLQL